MSTITAQLLAEDQVLFLGEDFLPWMVLAIGAALVAGNVLALVRPPEGAEPSGGAPGTGRSTSSRSKSTEPEVRPRPPLGRTVTMIVVGLVAAGWGLASLIA
jgi:hypothetical protein